MYDDYLISRSLKIFLECTIEYKFFKDGNFFDANFSLVLSRIVYCF